MADTEQAQRLWRYAQPQRCEGLRREALMALRETERSEAVAKPEPSGRPRRLPLNDDEVRTLHAQAKWLAQAVDAFAPEVSRFAERHGLTVDDAWAVRFPMLELELLKDVRNRLRQSRTPFAAIADDLVGRRGAIDAREVGRRRSVRFLRGRD